MKCCLKWRLVFLAMTFWGCGAKSFASEADFGCRLLDDCTKPSVNKIIHEGSWDRTGDNTDFYTIAPGQTKTIVNMKSSGTIRRLWCAVAARQQETLMRQALLRMYWDNEETPSVEVPLGDFFGTSWGRTKDFISMALEQTSGGYNCYWPMPFGKAARVELVNDSNIVIDKFYFNSDIEMMATPPKSERLYFHAQWRRENPTTAGKLYTILEAKGRGKYVGTSLQMQCLEGPGFGFLEGDEEVFVDGEKTPSIHGTGNEDYFMACWYFASGEFSAPWHGCLYKNEKQGRAHAYRWHLIDPIPFQKSILFQIEHGPDINYPTNSDYVSTAYWYQTEPHAAFPPLPTRDKRLPVPLLVPYKIPGAIEVEDFINSTARPTIGGAYVQYMTQFGSAWSNASQYFWYNGEPGATVTFPLEVKDAGMYQLGVYIMQAPDGVDLEILLNGESLGKISEYAPKVMHSDLIKFEPKPFKSGLNDVTFKIVGRDVRARVNNEYPVGIDCFLLTKI
ncbi:MAG: DUF2961 domain-containing protein [Planctomycetota bacterium]|nr:DUF2961 domain-containing protein [Planctomycetota bacterium]